MNYNHVTLEIPSRETGTFTVPVVNGKTVVDGFMVSSSGAMKVEVSFTAKGSETKQVVTLFGKPLATCEYPIQFILHHGDALTFTITNMDKMTCDYFLHFETR